MGWFKRKAAASEAPYAFATVTTQDEARSLYKSSFDADAANLIAHAHSYVAICAQRNAENVANVRLRLYRPARGDGNGRPVDDEKRRWLTGEKAWKPSAKSLEYAADAADMEEVVDHPALSLVRRPNPNMSGTDFRCIQQMFRELTGDSFTFVVGEDGEVPTAIYPMFPQWTRLIVNSRDVIEGCWYGRETTHVVELRRDEFWQCKLMESFLEPYRGYSPMKHIIPQADLYGVINQYWNTLFANQGRPDFVLAIKGVVPREERKALDSWMKSYFQGVWNAGKSLLAQGNFDVDVKPINWAPKDLGNMEIQKDAARAVLAAFGVPEAEVWLNDSNLASSNSGHVQYRRQTILPRVNKEADFWTHHLLEMNGLDGWWFAPDNPVPKDELSDATRLNMLVGGNILTSNEARKELGYGEIEGGDKLMYEATAGSVGMGSPPAPEEDNAHERGQDEQPTNEGEVEKAVVMMRRLPPAPKCCDHKKTVSQRELWTKAASPYTEPAPESFSGKVLGVFRGQRDALVDAMEKAPFGLNNKTSGRKTDDSLFDMAWAAWRNAISASNFADVTFAKTRTLIDSMLQVGSENGKAKVREVLPEYVNGPAFGFNTEAEAKWFDYARQEYKTRLVGVGAHTEEQVRATLQEGVRAGEGLSSLTRRVRNVFDAEAEAGTVAGWRAEMIARTESANAQVFGTVASYAGAGVNKKKPLLAPNACEYCATWARQFANGVPIEKPFYNLGETIIGTDGGILSVDFAPIWGADVHPNDRCDVLPVLGE
jgi:HK97 family phage portal protein